MAIGSVSDTWNWLYICDEKGKETVAMPVVGDSEFVGFCPEFLLIKNGECYSTYDQMGKKLGSVTINPSWIFSEIEQHIYPEKSVWTFDFENYVIDPITGETPECAEMFIYDKNCKVFDD